jgi:hypothetical protein
MSERVGPMLSHRFPPTTAAFELPCLTAAMELLNWLQSDWVGWIENGLAGTFVVVLAPERVSQLDELLGSVESWIAKQAFLAIRFHLGGRMYLMQRDGFIGSADGDHGSAS